MTTAQQIRSFYVKTKEMENGKTLELINWQDAYDECEEKAIEINQDYDAETTEYIFCDDSVLIFCNNEIKAYAQR